MSVKDYDFTFNREKAIVWHDEKTVEIFGNVEGKRLPSRVLEEIIQESVRSGARTLLVHADGQHGIGGRIFPQDEPVRFIVDGPVGQRLGSMGMFGTEIIVKGSASDDVGWLNAGARITVLGDVTNGAFNAAAQGVLYVQGGGGARCETLTKRNPKYDPPQSWFFRDVGDSFAEFKAGGISVVCGVNPRNRHSVLGYRPCVGMVGGVIYFRGKIDGYSEKDVRLEEIDENDWKWLVENMKPFLTAIQREEYFDVLTRSPEEWRKLVAIPAEERKRISKKKVLISEFRKENWEKEVGKGGIFADYINFDTSPLPYITTGNDRRFRPVWNNYKYAAPCEFSCPSSIPTQRRTFLLRNGRYEEAVKLILNYSPFPVSVCGFVCPSPCMDACSRNLVDEAVDIKLLGRALKAAENPEMKPSNGIKVAVVGGGPAGLSAAWQLRMRGYEVSVFEATSKLGGKMFHHIPEERLPKDIFESEIERIRNAGVEIKLNTPVDKELFKKIYNSFSAVVVAVGAQKPRRLNFPGSEEALTAYDFLKSVNAGEAFDLKGKKVLVIGAGNVGMDVASQAFALGAEKVTAIDIQKPAAFGKELETAVKKGVQIVWPKSIEKFDPKERRAYFTDGTSIEADTVIISIGDMPDIEFLPDDLEKERNFIKIHDNFKTSDPKIYAIGDVTCLGLVTQAIGHGRLAAMQIDADLSGNALEEQKKQPIDYKRIKHEYFGRESRKENPEGEAYRCISCGLCRDCGICEATCYYGAIRRVDKGAEGFEYVVDDEKCIGCGFCSGVCPCGIWEMVEVPY